MEKERQEEARKHEAKEAAAEEKVESVGKEAIYNTVGAKEAEEQLGVWGGAEAKEEKTQKKQDTKEEEEMSLPQTKEDYEPTAWAGWAGEGMVADGGARGAGGANQDAVYANIWAGAYAEFSV